jgi:hypothetical protein
MSASGPEADFRIKLSGVAIALNALVAQLLIALARTIGS